MDFLSDGNSEALAYTCWSDEENNTNKNQNQPQMFSRRSKCLTLETILGRHEDEEDENDLEFDKVAMEEVSSVSGTKWETLSY